MTGSYIIGLPHDTEYNIIKVMDFFSSDDCPLHSIEFDPLYVQNPQLDLNPWKSEYSVNASKHGFTFNDSLLNWSNDKSPYKNFKNCVSKADELVASLPVDRAFTIKSAAYMHLPNNINSNQTANEKFEIIFKFRTYAELNNYYNSQGLSIAQAKKLTANRYYDLFLQNHRNI